MVRLLGECVARAEAVVLSDVGVPVDDFVELLRRGLEEGCQPLSSGCQVAVKVYKECVVERCNEECRRRFCGGRLCDRRYWLCLAKCAAERGVPEASSNIGSWLLAGLV